MNEQEGTHLDAAEALKFAARLTLLPKFSPHPEALSALADYLSGMIHGQEWGGRWWTAHEQAEWLIEKILSTWRFWSGPAPMRELYTSRFRVSDELLREEACQAETAATDATAVACGICRDSGTVQHDGRFEWCACGQGQSLREQLPNWLDVLNRPAVHPLPADRIRGPDASQSAFNTELRQRTIRGIAEAEDARRKAKEATH